jgi:hypothetical protein
MRKLENICYCDIGHPRHYLDLYLPDCEEFDVFVYFHGGGLENGSKDTAMRYSDQYLLERNIALVMVNYRMYPSAVFPEFIRDAAAAVAWTFKNINNYGKARGIYVGGSSAGGYLSMMLCFDKSYLAPYKIHPTQIAGFIHDAGQPTSHFNVLRERGLDSRRLIIDETAPLYFIGQEPEYAPMLFIVSDNDMENRYEQTMLVLSTLKHFRYDQSKIALKVMNGTHCHYVSRYENGLGTLVHEFIETCNQKKNL